MTNRDIKFELGKLTLANSSGMPRETFMEFLKNVYDWIIEEPDVEVDVPKTEYDDEPIRNVVAQIRKSEYWPKYANRLESIFITNNIKTVGDLLRLGRTGFMNTQLVGRGSLLSVDEALENLGIKGW
jgi:hypothetical protein